MRRRGFFQRTGRRQIYLALFLGVVTSGYIWIPTIRELEVKRRTLDSDTKNTSSFQGNIELSKDNITNTTEEKK